MPHAYRATEGFVKQIYESIGVHVPKQLHPEGIAPALKLSVAYLPVRSRWVKDHIILDSRKPESVQWQEFGRELCHAVCHKDNHYHMTSLAVESQVNYARHFVYAACVPAFMLDQLQLPGDDGQAVQMIENEFGVEREFAEQRFHQYTHYLMRR